MKYLLDTNILSKILGGRSPQAKARLETLDPRVILVPSMVLAEIYHGILKHPHPEEAKLRWERFLQPLSSVAFTAGAARIHAHLRWELRHTPIGAHDLIIAATALEQETIVVTNNRREFDRVPGLHVEDWTSP